MKVALNPEIMRSSRLSVLFIIILAFNLVLADDDYYKIIGVSRDAKLSEIRRNFKKLALKHHPDKNKVDMFDFIPPSKYREYTFPN